MATMIKYLTVMILFVHYFGLVESRGLLHQHKNRNTYLGKREIQPELHYTETQSPHNGSKIPETVTVGTQMSTSWKKPAPHSRQHHKIRHLMTKVNMRSSAPSSGRHHRIRHPITKINMKSIAPSTKRRHRMRHLAANDKSFIRNPFHAILAQSRTEKFFNFIFFTQFGADNRLRKLMRLQKHGNHLQQLQNDRGKLGK